jgi:branched-chain amino acid transport system substrate-binding protein
MNKRSALLSICALLAGTSLARAEDIQIAVATPMTGPVASIGDQIKHGAELAAEAINKQGGVLGKTIKIVVEDDVCDPKQAVSVANHIVAEGIKFVDGHACSGASIPASAVYGDNGVLMMTPASSNPKLTEDAAAQHWTTIMRLYGRDDAQGAFIGPWIAKHYGSDKIAILHDKSAYGKGLADVVKASLNRAGLKEALYMGINPGEKDYRAVVTRLKGDGIQFVYYGGYHNEAGLLKRQGADQGYAFQLMSGDSIATPDFWAASGPAGEGTLFTFPPDGRESEAAKGAMEQFKQIGFVPEGFTLFSYATIQALAQGIAKAKSEDPKVVAKTLRSTSVDTVLGPVSFDEKGDIANPRYNINIWKNGGYAKLVPQD